MREELRIVNALIAMSHRSPGAPSLLGDLGFRLTAIQKDVGVAVPKGLVTPEAVFQSEPLNESVVVESKSDSFDEKQAAKYLALEGRDLVGYGLIHEPPPADIDHHLVSPIYFSQKVHQPTLESSIAWFNAQNGTSLPLVVYDNHELKLVTGAIRNSTLDSAFRAGLSMTDDAWPVSYVPFDAQSPMADICGPVCQALLVLLMVDDVEDFTAENLAADETAAGGDGCVRQFAMWGTGTRNAMLARIRDVVEELRTHYLLEYFTRTGPASWRKTRNVSGRGVATVQAAMQDYSTRRSAGAELPAPPGRTPRDVTGQLDVDDS